MCGDCNGRVHLLERDLWQLAIGAIGTSTQEQMSCRNFDHVTRGLAHNVHDGVETEEMLAQWTRETDWLVPQSTQTGHAGYEEVEFPIFYYSIVSFRAYPGRFWGYLHSPRIGAPL